MDKVVQEKRERLQETGVVEFIATEVQAERLLGLAREAVAACPRQALRLIQS